MNDSLFFALITWFQSHCSASEFTLLYLAFGLCLLLLSQRLAGLMGLYAFNALCLIAANIQVLGLGTFPLMSEPVALGLVTSSLSFLGNDIITEHHGKSLAQKGIYYSLSAQCLFLFIMLGGLGYQHHNLAIQEAMQALFIPGPRLVLASVLAYFASQYIEIQLFYRLKQRFQTKQLWLRTLLSLSVSAFIDTFIFSLLAWVIFSPTPVPLSTLFSRYIMMAYLMRLVVQALSVPCIYLSYYMRPASASIASFPSPKMQPSSATQP